MVFLYLFWLSQGRKVALFSKNYNPNLDQYKENLKFADHTEQIYYKEIKKIDNIVFNKLLNKIYNWNSVKVVSRDGKYFLIINGNDYFMGSVISKYGGYIEYPYVRLIVESKL